ncbi:MAG: hypothetical protein HY695_13355 [Deltaproteobacteria bacterium]|nr:hypothetical protein [Deltaproteobacteria bacterium]
MHWLKTTLLIGLLALLMGLAGEVNAAESRRGPCRRGDRLTIHDLDMAPDPIIDGQRIRVWRATVRLDSDRACETEIEIRDRDNDPASQPRRYFLRPGTNEVELPPVEGYRFRGREHCFHVIVNLEGTRRPVDADRRFCARETRAWSLRERGDRERDLRYR